MRPAFSAKAGSVGKIQERWSQGRIASSRSQRTIVECEASQTPRSTTRRWTSAVERRESGEPPLGGSQATALTSVICSGGETARPARARFIREAVEPLLAKASSPAPHRLPADTQPLADLGVGVAVGGHQHELRAQHLAVGAGVAGGAVLELGSLLGAQADLVGAASRHRPSGSPRSASILQARWDF